MVGFPPISDKILQKQFTATWKRLQCNYASADHSTISVMCLDQKNMGRGQLQNYKDTHGQKNRKQKKFFTKNKLIKIKSMSDFMSRIKQLCAHVFYFSCPIVSNRIQLFLALFKSLHY